MTSTEFFLSGVQELSPTFKDVGSGSITTTASEHSLVLLAVIGIVNHSTSNPANVLCHFRVNSTMLGTEPTTAPSATNTANPGRVAYTVMNRKFGLDPGRHTIHVACSATVPLQEPPDVIVNGGHVVVMPTG